MSDPALPLDEGRGQVGRVAQALGFAGLLPQFAAVWLAARPPMAGDGRTLAFAYAGLIASFIGGSWWGFALRRRERQGVLATLAVLPSLAVFALLIWTVYVAQGAATPLIVLGAGILLTLVVDRHLFRTGEAPRGWMALRVPLSIGLGTLTIVAGLV
jgi:hypothetical protein